MLDQTFSAENFKIIADLENRKGSNISSQFFPTVKTKTDEIKTARSQIRLFRKTNLKPYSKATQVQYDLLLASHIEKKQERDIALMSELRGISKHVSMPTFVVNFSRKPGPNGKPVCVLEADAASHYAMKLLCRNLSRLYKVRQANKNLICSQIVGMLADRFPYQICRFDIEKFYESIDHQALLKKLATDQLLSSTSLRMIRCILQKYSALAGTTGKGLPRGLGVSAYLSELAMREFDAKIKNGQDVVYYARYVDDIVVVFAPTKTSNVVGYKKWFEENLAAESLSLNPAKEDIFSKSDAGWDFDYLGYHFSRMPGGVRVTLSDSKHEKYKKRLAACFRAYHRERKKSTKAAHRLLVRRMQFLTGNTQLKHSKENAYVGIYYANPLLNDAAQLRDLDHRRQAYSRHPEVSAKLRSKLDKLSFSDGFSQRTFSGFYNGVAFEEIVRAWRYVA